MSYKFFKTIDPLLYDLNVYYEKDLYEKATNFSDLLKEGTDILDDFIAYKKSLVEFDPIQSQTDLFVNLDQSGLEKYKQLQYKVYWYEKYLTAIEPVKKRFFKKLKSNIKIFKEISDSIGTLRNVDFLPDDSLLAVYDIDFDLVSTSPAEQLVPVNYNTNVQNKLSENTQLITGILSRYCTSTFRHNMVGITPPFSNSKDAHGSNLVVDYFHFDRIFKIARQDLETILIQFYGDLYDIIAFYENYEPASIQDNLQVKQKGAIGFTLEGLTKTTDYLKQEVGFYKNVLVNLQSLSTQSV